MYPQVSLVPSGCICRVLLTRDMDAFRSHSSLIHPPPSALACAIIPQRGQWGAASQCYRSSSGDDCQECGSDQAWAVLSLFTPLLSITLKRLLSKILCCFSPLLSPFVLLVSLHHIGVYRVSFSQHVRPLCMYLWSFPFVLQVVRSTHMSVYQAWCFFFLLKSLSSIVSLGFPCGQYLFV